MKFIRSDPKLKRHYRKNQFWFWKALETYALGLYFIIRVNVFDQVPPPPEPHRTIPQMFDDPIFIFTPRNLYGKLRNWSTAAIFQYTSYGRLGS